MVTTRSRIKRQPQPGQPEHASKPKCASLKSDVEGPTSIKESEARSITAEVKQKMNKLLSRLTSSSSTICPSQIARGLNRDHPASYPDWRAMMNPVRDIVWEEVRKGKVEVTQGGVARTLEEREELKGPIRVRKGKGWDTG